MISKTIKSEFGEYNQKYNHGYEVNHIYFCIDSFVAPENIDEWMNCPCCGLKPKVWLFNNGESTACGCWNDKYDRFSVMAESVMSAHCRKKTSESIFDYYSSDRLRKNWNECCATMINPCDHSDLRSEGKW